MLNKRAPSEILFDKAHVIITNEHKIIVSKLYKKETSQFHFWPFKQLTIQNSWFFEQIAAEGTSEPAGGMICYSN